MDGLMDGWMDGWMVIIVCVCVCHTLKKRIFGGDNKEIAPVLELQELKQLGDVYLDKRSSLVPLK